MLSLQKLLPHQPYRVKGSENDGVERSTIVDITGT